MNTKPLTPKEMAVLEFLRGHMTQKGFVPSYEEIRDRFRYASIFSVQQYLKQLETKGYLRVPGGNKKRAIELINVSEELNKKSTELPLLGRVAAGRPIEAIEGDETIDVSPTLLGDGGQYFALRVAGDSMIGDGIFDQDIVVIRKQANAENGQTVVALVNNEATIKRFFKHKGQIELRAANPAYQPISVTPDATFKIEGILCGLIRRFK